MTDQSKSPRRPQIEYISPNKMKQNSEDTLRAYGSDFEESSYIVADGFFLRTTWKSSERLEASLITQVTGSTGDKEVYVHDNSGLSNKVTLTVE